MFTEYYKGCQEGSTKGPVSRILTERLFSAGEFRFSLGISSVEPADFFRNIEGNHLLKLRRQALDSSLSDYLQPIADETIWLTMGNFVGRLEPRADAKS